MSIGPCLCGDTACPHCGNPEIEAAEDKLMEAFFELKMSPAEYKLAQEVAIAAVKAYREAIQEPLGNIEKAHAQHIAHLEYINEVSQQHNQDRIARLMHVLGEVRTQFQDDSFSSMIQRALHETLTTREDI